MNLAHINIFGPQNLLSLSLAKLVFLLPSDKFLSQKENVANDVKVIPMFLQFWVQLVKTQWKLGLILDLIHESKLGSGF